MALLILIGAAAARGDDGFGVGIILGEPTGLSVKKWLGPEQAVDAAAAWSFSDNDSFQLQADYLFHRFDLIAPDAAGDRFPLYAGIGARVKFEGNDSGRNRDNNDTRVGVRIPLGIACLLAKAPLDFFAEIVPVLDLAPDTEFDLNAAIGARYYFR